MITAKLDEAALARYLKVLDKNRGKPLAVRAERVIAAAARLAIPALKAVAPKGPRKKQSHGPILILNAKRRRTLASSAGTKRLRKRGGEVIAPTWLGYKVVRARWLQEGTSAHSLATRGVVAGARGRWTKTGRWRSALASLGDDQVVPLAGIYVSGISGRPLVQTAWDQKQSDIYSRIERDIWETS